MRFLICIVLLQLFFSLVFSQSHHVSWGNLQTYDAKFFNEVVREESKWLRVTKEEKTFDAPGEIHFINVTDQYTDGNGGMAMITSGGVGSHHVTLQFKSKRSHGYNFIIEIFGK